MPFAFRSLVFFALAACAACTSTGPAATNAPEQPDASPPAPFVESAPWKETSVRIELTSFGFFVGSMQYAKDRSALTAAQLQALAGLRTSPDLPSGGRSRDEEFVDLTIVDADGSRALLTTTSRSDAQIAAGGATVASSTLSPFLATLSCAKAKSACTATPGGMPRVGCNVTIPDDPGCLDGVFVPNGCIDAVMSVDISRAGTYDLSTIACIGTVDLKLFDTDGTTVLGTSTPGSKPSCSSLTHTFEAAGTFRLVLEKRQSDCSATGQAGDMYLRVSAR